MKKLCVLGLIAATFVAGESGWAIESAQVLPAGVRNVNFRLIRTQIGSKTNNTGHTQPLAQSLNREVTFSTLASGESDASKSKSLKAFLLREGLEEDDVVGNYTADMNGYLQVFAPVFAYGLTDKMTLAIAVPYFTGETAVEVGFQTGEAGQRLINAMSRDEVNLRATANKIGSRLNQAVGTLNDTLIENGYEPLDDWQGSGIGDINIILKTQVQKAETFVSAVTTGVIAPTGRTDDPDILNDVPFGDGQWDVFGQGTFDQPMPGGLTLTEYAKYTVQLPGTKTVRAKTLEESIKVDKEEARFKLGDKIDAGMAMTYKPSIGLISSLGYAYFQKYSDIYRDVEGPVKAGLEKDTEQQLHSGVATLGYTTLPLFRSGSFPVPIEYKMSYTKQFASRNMTVRDLAQMELSLFF